MNPAVESPDHAAERRSAEPTSESTRARLDRIFGNDEPASTRDDLPEPAITRSEDQWYLENRPPHHEG